MIKRGRTFSKIEKIAWLLPVFFLLLLSYWMSQTVKDKDILQRTKQKLV